MSEAATAGAPLRVVIADDQTLVRSGFRLILNEAGITVARVRELAKAAGFRRAGRARRALTGESGGALLIADAVFAFLLRAAER